MKILVPAPPSDEAPVDPVEKYPADVAHLVAVVKAAGYQVSLPDAGEIWRRYSEILCATWLSPSGWSEAEILKEMTRNGVVMEEPATHPTPPKGYTSWLEYAVLTMDTRSPELEGLFDEGKGCAAPTQVEMRQAVKAEFEELRQRARIRGQHRLSERMAEMPDGMPRAEG